MRLKEFDIWQKEFFKDKTYKKLFENAGVQRRTARFDSHKICETIDHNELINELASVKVRHVML